MTKTFATSSPTGYLLANGTVSLTGDWNAGTNGITAGFLNAAISGQVAILRANRTDGKIAALGAGTGAVGFYFDDSGSFNLTSTTRTILESTSLSGTSRLNIDGTTGNIGIHGKTGASAYLHIPAGTASIPPAIVTSGTSTTTPITGAIEYNGNNFLFVRTGTTKETICCAGTPNVVSPTAPNRTIPINIGNTTYYFHAKTTND